MVVQASGWYSSDVQVDGFTRSRVPPFVTTMDDQHQTGFLEKDLVSESAVYDDEDDVAGLHFTEDASDTAGTRQWKRFASPRIHIRNLSQSSPRLRHAFPPSTPETFGRSPTLPLYVLERGSFISTPPRTRSHKRVLARTQSFRAATSSVLAQLRLSPLWNSQFAWLILYFTFNLLLTLSNKSVLMTFPFPYTLTALHALFSTLGGSWLRWRGVYASKRLSRRKELVLSGFSVLYAINIAVSNLSLTLVTVPFHQVVRAITPIFTMLLSAVFFDTRFSRRRLFALSPVILGVALATYGDYYFTAWGLCLTLFGTFLAALKTIYTNVLQASPKPVAVPFPTESPIESSEKRHAYFGSPTNTQLARSVFVSFLRSILPPRLDLHPLDLLTRMSPLAFVQCVIYAQLSGELERVRQYGSGSFVPSYTPNQDQGNLSKSYARGMDLTRILVLLVNGSIAFGLNIVSFSANGKVGPLSMTVAANVKQVLTILFAVSLFDLTITPTNALGITITLLGGAWYAWEEYTAKARTARRTAS